MQELAFERVNKHRALAEVVVYNRNWLPWWLTTAVVGDFCEQAERFLRGEGLPPLPVRLWWAYKHWRFRRGVHKTSRRYLREHHKTSPKAVTAPNPMVFSNVAGRHYKPCDIIPLAPGQKVEFIPIDNGHRLTVTDMGTGERRAINVSNRMLRSMYRPFVDHDLSAHVPALKDVATLHTDEGEFQVDVTQVRDAIRQTVRGTDTPLHVLGQIGVTAEEFSEAVRKIGNAGVSVVTPEVQEPHDNICNFRGIPLARVTNRKPMKHYKGYR
jgi:hypothetical protein